MSDLAAELRLVAIAAPPLVGGESLVGGCARAVAGGATAVQLRVKGAPAAELLELAERLVAALPVPVYVNDRADVARAARARGVHVGQDDVAPSAIRVFAEDALVIGLSVGTPREAEAALTQPADYWSIGALFATNTKPDAGAPIGPDGFSRLAARAPAGVPVIAIGGITAETAPAAIRAGACGVAVSSAIFGATDIERATRAVRDAVERAASAGTS